VLSEIPEEWKAAVLRWHALNRRHRSTVKNIEIPERNTEYLLYQTLVGALPLHSIADDSGHARFVARIQAYMQKATREAKVHTSWINPDPEYDSGLARFIEAVLDRWKHWP
jgi:(1->4)-alpha-D-glucan 1-alpha-D-glucosylmutase